MPGDKITAPLACPLALAIVDADMEAGSGEQLLLPFVLVVQWFNLQITVTVLRVMSGQR